MQNTERIELEYSINTIPKILYYRLSNPSGLEEWFANKVIVKNFCIKFISSCLFTVCLQSKTVKIAQNFNCIIFFNGSLIFIVNYCLKIHIE